MADDVLRPKMEERVEIDTSLPFQSVKAAVSMFGEKVNGKRIHTVEKPNFKNPELLQLKEELAAVKRQLAEAEEEKTKAYEELRDSRKLLTEMYQGFGDACTTKQAEICDVASVLRMQDDNLNMGGSKLGDPSPEQSNKSSFFSDGSELQEPPTFTEQSNKSSSFVHGTDRDISNKDASKQGNPKAEEKHVVWEVELKVAQEQHMNAVAELESVKNDLKRLKEELVASLREKENALRQAEEALMAAELNAKRVEELSHEMSGTNESLVLVKMACIEANKERAALLAAKGGPSPNLPHSSEHSMIIVEELEMKLAVATKDLTRLQQELSLAKDAEVRVASAASEAYANLALVKSELEKTRIQTCIADGSSCSHSPELKMRKHELEKAVEFGASLQATLDSLQRELDTMRKELGDLRDREAIASAAVGTLSAELARTKEELSSAVAAETKANEAVTVLTQTLQQIKAEADEARANADILMGEATQARVDAEYAKSALGNAEQEMKVAIEAAEVAKAAERDALERFKALSEKMSEERSLRAEVGSISISEDEYEQLKKKVNEAEELANMRIAAANAQVEVVKLSEMELQQKMKALSDDINTMRSNTEQALQKAEMAESAKRVVENEMRRWRENGKGGEREFDRTAINDERWIDKGMKSTMQKIYGIKEVEDASSQLVLVNSKSQSLSYSSVPPPESLAQILNMKMPSLVNEARTLSDRSLGQRKKKHYILPTLNIFSSKKNQPLAGSVVET